MNDLDNSKEELIREINKLREEITSLKSTFDSDTKQRQQKETILQESEEKYRNIVESSLVGVFKTEIGGKIIYVNNALVKMLEFDSIEECIHASTLILYKFPEQRKEWIENLKRDGQVDGFESNIITKKGNERFFLSSSVLNGTIINGTLIDITKRIITERKLKISEETNRLLYEHSEGAILFTKPDGTIFSANPVACKILGRSEAEIQQLGRSGIMDTTDPRLGEALEERKRTGVFKGELRMIRKDGTIFPVELSSKVFKDSLGNERTSMMFHDISIRKRAQEGLIQSQLLLKASLESQRDTILFSIDKDYRYLYYNKAHADAMKFAYGKDVSVGMSILECITSEEDQIAAKDNYDRALKGETHSNIRVFGDINLAYYESFFNPIFNDRDEIVGATGLARNISERIKHEEEIKLQNEMLQNLNATKDKFFSIIAHDLRSPFNAFLGLTQILAEDLQSLTFADMQNIAKRMSNSATSLYRLLENLLQWSQIQKGAITFNPEIIQLKKAVNESLEMVKEMANLKNIEISIDIQDNQEVFADNIILQTVFRNILSNAIKFTPQKGRVRLSAKINDEDTVEISVKDTGIGMSREILDCLFRIDKQTKRKGTDGEPSTGLGLILCHELIVKQRGNIRVESEVGIGSTFYFTIPMKAIPS